ncbi:type II secretion system protein [Candidatus Parcubacteria bacterium]|nr:MAG: type II secretion system protein [Candidatus Parcubacteria bacterium]
MSGPNFLKNFNKKPKTKLGFTLIELLVVITIINVLASTILVSANQGRFRARQSRRVSDMRELQKAIELYNLRNNSYPNTGGAWYTACNSCTLFGGCNQPRDAWIPGLAPTFIRSTPVDPLMPNPASNNAQGDYCYVYRSDTTGREYKLMAHRILEFTGSDYTSQQQMIDPRRDGTVDCTVQTNNPNNIFAWAIYTPGGCAAGW